MSEFIKRKSESHNNASQQKSGGYVADNRESAIEHQSLQDKANNSTQVSQLAQLKEKAGVTQKKGKEEDEMLQGKFESVQMKGVEEEEPLQAKSTEQTKGAENSTGLPDNLKSGIESLSGYSMDDVNVHYNSSKPSQLQAHAYAQGTDIHMAPGQEKHLPHEAWHVAQQKQGRVQPTMQMKGAVNVNDDQKLEQEADVMGAKALQMKPEEGIQAKKQGSNNAALQLKAYSGTRSLGQKSGDKSKDWNFGFGNLRLVHEHIWFDNSYQLPKVGAKNNIGFHDNELFSEDVSSRGYTTRDTYDDEGALVEAINENDKPGEYNLITNNCQDWVTSVRDAYNKKVKAKKSTKEKT